MNYEFLQLLDKAKTPENAKNIEAIKRLYTICEFKNDPKTQDESSIKYMNETAGIEYNGHEISDTCYVFDCDNGTVRLTLVDSSTVLIEVSPTGTDSMYHVVGKVGIDTEVGEAIKVGVDALNDDTLMESFVGDMAGKAVDFGKNAVKKAGKAIATGALAVSPSLVGCAGNTPDIDNTQNKTTIDYVADEYGINPTEVNDGNTIIPNLVKAITDKIAQQTDSINGLRKGSEAITIAQTPAAKEAKDIYNMLKDGEIKVSNYTLDPERHTQAMAQKAAADSFAGGLRNMFHKKLGVQGEEFLKELN